MVRHTTMLLIRASQGPEASGAARVVHLATMLLIGTSPCIEAFSAARVIQLAGFLSHGRQAVATRSTERGCYHQQWAR